MLVLASKSPRRKDILSQAGIPFVVKPVNVDETRLPEEEPISYVKRIARRKAEAIEAAPDDVILGADTIVLIAGEMLGKPAAPADAARMLKMLSGREHVVISGICLMHQRNAVEDVSTTRVWFASLSPEEISDYVASGEPMDKAGAYAIQGLASKFIERIDGCYWNVVGLPISMVYRHLKAMRLGPAGF